LASVKPANIATRDTRCTRVDQPSRRLAARGEQEADTIRVETPGGEPQRLDAGRVHPRRVVHHHEHRRGLARHRQQIQTGDGDGEWVDDRHVRDTQGARQGIPPHPGQAFQTPVQQRRQHVEQPAVAEVRLALHPAGPHQVESVGQAGRTPAQPTLPDSGRPDEDQ
jgi:hypothetical protein